MEIKAKNCKGISLTTKGYGCDEPVYKRTYGLCNTCLRIWATTTEAGMSWLKIQTAYKIRSNIKKEKSDFKKRKRAIDDKGAMRLADTYFSRYIRLFYSKDRKCTCYTCGNIYPIKEVDNGHYQKREHKSVRYDENNCRPQCKTCNGDVKHNGKQDIFRVNLVNEIGEELVAELEQLTRTTIKANNVFYRMVADEYRNKLNELQLKLKVKIW